MRQGATRKTTNRRSFRGVKRVGRMLLGTGVVLVMVALVGAAAWRLLELPVERVMVTGELRHVSREHLVSRVNESLQGGFLWVDLQAIRRSLEQLPWVYRVVVKRHWPNSLEIQVFEQLPIARWSDDAYLNHTGEVFRPAQLSSQQQLPLLAGPAGSELQLMQYYQLLHDPLQTVGLRLNALAMDARGGLRAELDGGGELVFGRGEVAAKLRRFLHIYQSRLARRDGRMRSVDLRYSHGAAVVWASKDKNQKTWGEPAHG